MDSFKKIVDSQMEFLFGQRDKNSYLAHICPGKEAESLEEHVKKVMKYICLLVDKHGLEKVIDGLIEEVAADSSAEFGNELKWMLVNVFLFHDNGKVNENFQIQRMGNRMFSVRKTEMLEPPYGHSFLGSWLFSAYTLDRIWDNARLTEDEKKSLFVYTFCFSYLIRLHHCSGLGNATDAMFMNSFAGCYEELQDYLTVWRVQGEWRRIEAVFKCICGIQKETEKCIDSSNFALYALLKLTSSLLTAADYLATHEYMNDQVTGDVGVFDDRERVNEIVRHLRDYKHNRIVYSQVDSLIFQHPVERSAANLNQLRTEMAVELIRTIRENPNERLFYVEAPTGGGKSNLSMIAVTELMAKHSDIQNVFYVFPFTTLATQTCQTLKATLGLTSSELIELHSKAAFLGKEENEEDGLYGNKKKDYIERLFALYPVCVLSHVKFFDILKSNHKEANYWLHRLANSVVVIDELQTYNPMLWDKMYYLIGQYAHLFNIRFILMSATLPKIGNLNIPLIKDTGFVDLLPNARKYIINPNFAGRVKFRFDLLQIELDISYLAKFVICKSEEYAHRNKSDGTVHTIIEFIYKRSASEFYGQIKEMTSFFDEILVLSGTILESRRREVINELKNPANRRKNILLITTQVVEAGVDIDMDLGFKNISLPDNDEQLAGRVNRNAQKDGCEVYLFRLDEAKVIYGKDKRFQIVREYFTSADYERMLDEKDYSRMYELVFEKIDKLNQQDFIQNFNTEFQNGIGRLDFAKVDKEFQIIEQKNETIFVPLKVPIEINTAEEGVRERLFSGVELAFLEMFGVVPKNGELDGCEVWGVYERLINHSGKREFSLDRQIDFKIIQRIMSWFTFSLIYQCKDLQELKCGLGEDKLGYFYLSHWDEEGDNGCPYDYKMGLNTKAFKDIAFI